MSSFNEVCLFYTLFACSVSFLPSMDIYGMDIDPRNDAPPELVEQRKRGVIEPNMDDEI